MIRTTKKHIDNLLESLAILTRLDLAYQHFNGNQFQLYVGSSGNVDRTIGRVITGPGNFYDVLKAAVDIGYAMRAKKQLVSCLMENERIKELLHLSNAEYKQFLDYQKKAENAKVCYCDLHDIEWFDFEAGCYACIEEREEFQAEVKANEIAWRAKQ